MADYKIMKAVEFDKLPVSFRKTHPAIESLRLAGWWLQKKYDGCFGAAYIHMDRDLCHMESRTGEKVKSCDHLLSELWQAFRFKMNGWEPVWVLGEVWRPIDEAAFPQISGEFRRHTPAVELRFIVNDIIPSSRDTRVAYQRRYADAMYLLGTPEYAGFNCRVAHTAQFWQAEELANWVTPGYDGVILRDPASGYTVGTVKRGEIVKVKPTLTLDLRIKRVTVDVRATKLGGYITVDMGNDIECDVGTGLTQADLASFQNELARGAWINKIAEIEALGVTADGKLREPRFKGLRFDKEAADR